MLDKARANFGRAGLDVPLKQMDARGMTPPSVGAGILVANPPYGERIEVRGRGPRGEIRQTGREKNRDRDHDDDEGFQRAHEEAPDSEFFKSLGDALKQRFTGWHAFILTSTASCPVRCGCANRRRRRCSNGALECRLFRFDLVAGSVRRPAADTRSDTTGGEPA